MYTVTPRTMTAMVFAMIALTFGGILAGFGFALLTERPQQPAQAVPTPFAAEALARSLAVPAASAAEPAPVETDASVPVPASPPAPAAQPAPQRPSRTVVGDAASVTLEMAQVNRRDGGIEVAIRLQNEGDRPLSFPFSPGQNLVVDDDQGHVYQVRWASYDGEVRLAPGQSTSLTHALFVGPIDQRDVRNIQIRTRDLPGIVQASWQIEIAP